MKKKKSAIVYCPIEGSRVFETGDDFSYVRETFAITSIIENITIGTDNVLYIHFQNNAMLMFCNVPFEYFEMPEGEE